MPRRHEPLRPQRNPCCAPRHFLLLSRRICPDEPADSESPSISWRGAVESSQCFEVVPQGFLPVLCRLAGGRIFPLLESPGEQQSLRESLVTLSGQDSCEQKPSLANYRFNTLAPGFLEVFSVTVQAYRVRRSTGRFGVQVHRVRRSTGRSGVQVHRVRRSSGRSGVQVHRVRRSTGRSSSTHLDQSRRDMRRGVITPHY